MRRALAIAAVLLSALPAYADMFQDASNAAARALANIHQASGMPELYPAIVCDAATDNKPAIQAAIDNLEARTPSGGTIRLPACNKIAVASELRIRKPGITIAGVGATDIPKAGTLSYWYDNPQGPAATVLGWTGGAGAMVRFEPAAGDIQLVGGGLKNIVLAGRGLATNNLLIKGMRSGVFDHVVAENCTGNCVEFNATQSVLAAGYFCDNARHVVTNLRVQVQNGIPASVNANGLVLDGLADNSIPPDGCVPMAEKEVNTAYSTFHTTFVRSGANGVGIDLRDAVDNIFTGLTGVTGGTGGGVRFRCAQADGRWPARRNVFDALVANPSIVSESCQTNYMQTFNPAVIPGDSPKQNWLRISTSVGGEKPTFEGAYSPDVSMFWQAMDGDGNYEMRGQDYRSNYYYAPDGLHGPILNGNPPGVNVIVCRPVNYNANGLVRVEAMGINVTTIGAGGSIQGAIYTYNDGTPGALIGATASMSTAAVASVSGNFPLVLGYPPTIGSGSYVGRVFFACFNTNSATAAYTTMDKSLYTTAMIGGSPLASVLANPQQGFSCAGAACAGGSSTFGTWPATLAGSTWTNVFSNTIPIPVLRMQQP